MNAPRLALIASAPSPLAAYLNSAFSVAWTYYSGNAEAGTAAPDGGDLAALIERVRPTHGLILDPYEHTAAAAQALDDAGVEVCSLGPSPVETARAVGYWGRLYAFDPRHVQLAALRARPGFGKPVYLRLTDGGGSCLWSAWWAACGLLERAMDLIDAPLTRLYLAANQAHGDYHLVITASFGATEAHLSVVPTPLPAIDALFLGSGGLLADPPVGNGPTLITPQGSQPLVPDRFATVARWLRQHLASPPAAATAPVPLFHRLLEAIPTAVAQGPRLISLDEP